VGEHSHLEVDLFGRTINTEISYYFLINYTTYRRRRGKITLEAIKKPKTYEISEEQGKEISKLRKTIDGKQVDKRLRAVQLRGEGKKNQEIAEILETSSDVISQWVSAFAKGGLEALLPKKRESHRHNMSFEEEAAFLAAFEESGEAGQLVEVSEIKRAYQELAGHQTGGGQIYYVLKRHGWRKIKPRSRHPKKASHEVIETSKKLTLES